jgi:hypothetical protein
MIKGRATIKPHKGPATPISKSAFLLMITPFILIMAPNVPKGSMGKGMKNGNVEGIPYFLVMREWPISCASRIVIMARL